MTGPDRWRIASFRLGSLDRIAPETADVLRRTRYGELSVRGTADLRLFPRWWPRIATHWDVLKDSYIKRLDEDECSFYYSFPRSSPGFMTVNYIVSGPKTHYPTLKYGIGLIDQIASLCAAKAIVCQTCNARLSETVMNRWGYVQHAQSLGNNHYIKRLLS
jgi:hypothetical protein